MTRIKLGKVPDLDDAVRLIEALKSTYHKLFVYDIYDKGVGILLESNWTSDSDIDEMKGFCSGWNFAREQEERILNKVFDKEKVE